MISATVTTERNQPPAGVRTPVQTFPLQAAVTESVRPFLDAVHPGRLTVRTINGAPIFLGVTWFWRAATKILERRRQNCRR